MKNILIATIVAALISGANAMQMDWQVNANQGDAGATVYAMLGSTTSGVSFKSVSDITSNENALKAADTSDYLLGTIVSKGRGSYGADGSVVSDNLTETSASFFFVIVNPDNSGYWLSGINDGSSFVYSPGQTGPGKVITDQKASPLTYTSFSAVPEPATGALALAGIALLLKRRKAAKA